jgi:antirestriction protein ArdC
LGAGYRATTKNREKPMPTVPEIITENVIKQLEQGVAPWRKPWSTSVPRNLITKKSYRGLNVFMLATQGYGSCYGLTFNQAKQLGAHVRQGEKSSMVMFWKIDELVRRKTDAEPSDEKGKSFLLRYYRVFNIEQCHGLSSLRGDDRKPVNPFAECESIADRMPNPPRIEQHSQAFYRPSADMVGMPSRNCFESPEAYYSTLFHELTHSTGHRSRLNRFEESADHQFGSESYSKEELVAEMGAAMLAGIAGISNATLSNSASYLQTWITRLKSDSRLIISAASLAQKAADHILGKIQNEGRDSQ